MRKIRVLHCLQTIGSGGVEQRRLILASNLNSEKYNQSILCTQAIGGLPEKFIQNNCSIYQVGVPKSILDIGFYIRAYKIIRRIKPDIIHGAVYEGVAVAAVCGRLAKVPIITGEETSDPKNRRWKGHLLYYFLTKLVHHMVAVSDSVGDYLVHKVKLPKSKLSVIKNAVFQKESPNINQLSALRVQCNIPEGGFVIGTVSRLLDEHKCTSNLIRATAEIVKFYSNVKLLIIGSGPDEEYLRNLTVQLGVVDYVLFMGYQSNTRPYYALMDIFALVSAHEAFGLVLVEAMFAKLPVIATTVGGIPEIVEDGQTGLLIEKDNVQQIVNAVIKLYDNAPLRREMVLAGYKRAKEHFSAERYVEDIDNLYQRLYEERVPQ